MGEDLIYTFRKAVPHCIVAILVWLIFFAVTMITLSSSVGTARFWALFGASIGAVIVYMCFELYKPTRLVKGSIGGIPVSDLTKSIYWLSAINTGITTFALGGILYGQNVARVAMRMGGEAEAKWQEVAKNYKIPSTKSTYSMIIFAFAAMGAMMASIIIFVHIQIWAVGLIIIALFGVLALAGSQFKNVRLMTQDQKAKDATNYLIQECISWISERTTKPVRVVVAGGGFSGAETVDSMFGYVIAEIRPLGKVIQPSEMAQSQQETETERYTTERMIRAMRRQRWIDISIHVFAALGMGFTVYMSALIFLSGKAGALGTVVLGVTVLAFAFLQYYLYTHLPLLHVMIKSGKASASDLQMIVKRNSKGLMENLCRSDQDFRAKTSFLIALCTNKSASFSTLPETVKLWLREEASQPAPFRYFIIDRDSVSLTSKGEVLAEMVRQKVPDEAQLHLHHLF